MKKNKLLAAYAVAVIVSAQSVSVQAATVTSGNTIPSAEISNFNGFENVGRDYFSTNTPYVENGISVTQFDSTNGEIWTTFDFAGASGDYVWYPSGGDNGYTEVKLSSNNLIPSISMSIGNGWNNNLNTYLNFALYNNASLILSGSVLQSSLLNNAITFSGFDFNIVNLSATYRQAANPRQGAFQALAIDNVAIERAAIATVPEPSIVFLIGLGLLSAGFVGRSKTSKA